MMSDFPYTVDDEPTEDWTVEQVMHWWLLRAHAESEAEFDKIVDKLSQQLEQGKRELWEVHKQVTDIINRGDDVEDGDEDVHPMEDITNENVPFSSLKDDTEKAPAKPSATDPTIPICEKPNTVRVDIVSGEYVGQSFNLQPQHRSHCWVGRSQGKKFRDKGISLPKDLEVSTSHGRFEYSRGKFFYMDAASTNGSRIQGMDVEPNMSHEIQTGTEITVGQTIMRVTLMTI